MSSRHVSPLSLSLSLTPTPRARVTASIKTRLSSILIDRKIDFSNVQLKTEEKGEICTDESSVGVKELKHFSVVKMSIKRSTTSKKDVK